MSMRVFELVFPGTWLDWPDPSVAREIQRLLDQLETRLADAAVSLHLFQQAVHVDSHRQRRENWLRDQERRRASDTDSTGTAEDAWFRAEAESKRAAWKKHAPEGYATRVPFVHARSFIFSLHILLKQADAVISLLKKGSATATTPGIASAATDAVEAMRRAVPDLVGVRDSAYHLEHRALGRDRKGRKIRMQPIDRPMLKAPGGQGVVYVENLDRDQYETMLPDGRIGSVHVSEATLDAFRAGVQRMVDAFPWKGPKQLRPY